MYLIARLLYIIFINAFVWFVVVHMLHSREDSLGTFISAHSHNDAKDNLISLQAFQVWQMKSGWQESQDQSVFNSIADHTESGIACVYTHWNCTFFGGLLTFVIDFPRIGLQIKKSHLSVYLLKKRLRSQKLLLPKTNLFTNDLFVLVFEGHEVFFHTAL